MNPLVTRLFNPRSLVTAAAVVAIGMAPAARAAVVSYSVILDGPSESPPNASPGTGTGQVDVDAAAHTMHVHADFSGLVGTTTASHIHAPTLVAGTGTAGVATTTPTFAGFPLVVSAGTYDNTLDLTLASSYNPSFVALHGGTPAGAEASLIQSIVDGKAYLNIHSTSFTGGEIRGFLIPTAVPAVTMSWGRLRAIYR